MNWNDKQEVLEAVKQNPNALKFASEELRADKTQWQHIRTYFRLG